MARKKSIIVEGPDASGKSTLATALGEHYGIYTFRAGPKPTSTRHAHICMVYQNTWLKNASCVWDRHTAISNQGNFPPLSMDSARAHKMYMNQALEYAVLIICTGDGMEGHSQATYEDDASLLKMREEHTKVQDRYAVLAHDLHNVIRYDFNIKSFESLIEELDNAISIDIQRP